jgi:hypothetical protein
MDWLSSRIRACTLVGTKPTGVRAVNKKYVVRPTDEQREQIERLLRLDRAHARKLLYARILLKANVDGPTAGP